MALPRAPLIVDRRHATRLPPAGGAYVGQGKTMSGSDVAWGMPVPGNGRSVYAGITVKL